MDSAYKYFRKFCRNKLSGISAKNTTYANVSYSRSFFSEVICVVLKMCFLKLTEYEDKVAQAEAEKEQAQEKVLYI